MLARATRVRTPELMDQPGLDERAPRHALDALGRGNMVSRTAASIWPPIRSAAAAITSGPVRILDLACGGGHVAVDLARRCARAGISAEVQGYELSPLAVDYARAQAARAGVTGVRFEPLDVVHAPLPSGFDVIHCSLFLHHLLDDEAENMLRRMKAAGQLVVVSDLRRTSLGLLYTWVGCRLLSRSRVFHVDGVLSVKAAFTTGEARALAHRAGLHGATITNCWPQRFLLIHGVGSDFPSAGVGSN